MTALQTPPQTLYQKLVETHTVARLDSQNVLLYADLHIMNEYTSPQAFAGLSEAGRGVLQPGQNVAVVDHIVPTHPAAIRIIEEADSALQASNLRKNCDFHGIPLFDANDRFQGIEHVIAPELGMIRPGMVVLCGDSHTTTYGALGPWVSASAPLKSSMCWRPRPWCIAWRGRCASTLPASCRPAPPPRT
ncbi:3-isopropylmalate dehydratase large subunit [Chromobacterium violaceum]|uniref:3-isopropylmalate dehydratase n=1 Tax=Chromobacterium violaceum TaxID=536 RepID=A0A447TCJ7_CHRVL|nr:3-isopropylmalate dehydratase large subunit [Chromobacterium violaceum]